MSAHLPFNQRQLSVLLTASRAGAGVQVRWNEARNTGSIRVGRLRLTRPRSKERLRIDLERIQETLKAHELPPIEIEMVRSI